MGPSAIRDSCRTNGIEAIPAQAGGRSGLTARVDWTVFPNLSVQVYAEPFVSAGDYGDLRRITDPRADAYANRFADIEAATGSDGTVSADINSDGTAETFPNPDFNFKQFRSNAVLRW